MIRKAFLLALLSCFLANVSVAIPLAVPAFNTPNSQATTGLQSINDIYKSSINFVNELFAKKCGSLTTNIENTRADQTDAATNSSSIGNSKKAYLSLATNKVIGSFANDILLANTYFMGPCRSCQDPPQLSHRDLLSKNICFNALARDSIDNISTNVVMWG